MVDRAECVRRKKSAASHACIYGEMSLHDGALGSGRAGRMLRLLDSIKAGKPPMSHDLSRSAGKSPRRGWDTDPGMCQALASPTLATPKNAMPSFSKVWPRSPVHAHRHCLTTAITCWLSRFRIGLRLCRRAVRSISAQERVGLAGTALTPQKLGEDGRLGKPTTNPEGPRHKIP